MATHCAQNMSITVSEKLMQQAADSVNKIRATLRYLNGVIVNKSEVLNDKSTFLDRYILSALVEHENEVCH